jgi:hypothetical protein
VVGSVLTITMVGDGSLRPIGTNIVRCYGTNVFESWSLDSHQPSLMGGSYEFYRLKPIPGILN